MFRLLTRSFCIISVLFAAITALAQAEFSAELYDLQKGETSQAKMYFGKDRIRFEPTQQNARGGGAFIVNLSTQTSIVLMDQQHMYMELPQQAAAQRNPYAFSFTAIGDIDAACSDLVGRNPTNGATCHKVGSDTVNGRSAVKYESTDSNGNSSTFWIDPKLRFPIKVQGRKNNWELRNIQEGAQSASLFEVPAGYKKFDMPNMGNMGGMQRPQ
jgi:hypothetical protein